MEKWTIPIMLNGEPVGIASFEDRERIEGGLLGADCILAPAIRHGITDQVNELDMFPAKMHKVIMESIAKARGDS